MIQDIGRHHYNNTYLPQPPCEDSYVLYYEKRMALSAECGEELAFPRLRDVEKENPGLSQRLIYLFSIDEERFYLAEELVLPRSARPADSQPDPQPGSKPHKGAALRMISIMDFRSAKPRYLGFAGILGHQLSQWYKSRRFCGRCGSPMEADTKERMLRCPGCGQMEYPKICPAVIVAVKDGNRLLLTKYAGRGFKRYALIAGFCEIGETLEDTVRREVMEEVGLTVTNLRYYKSQPWPFSDSLLAGFFCDLAKPGSIHLQEEELSLAEWIEREDLPIQDPAKASLTNEMIQYFHEGGS